MYRCYKPFLILNYCSKLFSLSDLTKIIIRCIVNTVNNVYLEKGYVLKNLSLKFNFLLIQFENCLRNYLIKPDDLK